MFSLQSTRTNSKERVKPEATEESALLYDAFGHEDEDVFPDGGFTAWRVVAGSFIGLMTVFGIMDTMASIQLYITNNQLINIELSKISWIFSLYMFTNLSMGIIAGPIFDVYGVKWVLLGGMTLNCGGLFATAFCKTLWQFVLAFGICTGIGSGITITPLVGVVNHWFLKKRAIACGIAQAGSVSGIFFPIMLRSLYPSIGFVKTMVIVASTCVVFCICSFLLVKDRSHILSADESHIPKKQRIKQTFKNTIDFRNFKEMRYTYLVAGMFFNEFSIVLIITYIATYGRARGLDDSTCYIIVTVMNAAGVLGKLIPPLLADYMGRFNTMILTGVAMTISIFGIWLPYYNLAGFYIFAIVYGIGFSSAYTLTPVLISQISHTRQFGSRYATAYFFVAFGNLICMPVGGQFLAGETVHAYNNMIIFAGCTCAMSTFFFLLSRYEIVGWKVWHYV